MKLHEIIDIVTKDFPLELQDEYDNSGLQIGTVNKSIKRILITLDITKVVVEEAVLNQVDFILSHHPLIFSPLKQINFDEYYGSLVSQLIQNDIAVFSMHTNYDKAKEGMNYQLLKAMGATDIKESRFDDFLFTGKIEETNLDEFVELIKTRFKRENIRYSGKKNVKISKIGIVGGSGGDYPWLNASLKEGLDLYITGDTKSSRMRYAVENGLNVLDVSHNIEEIFVQHMEDVLSKYSIEIIKSKVETDPYIFL